ncbi:MAG: hypothetical protein E6772_05480 [Dysgonomonas sp.]|nr:hypothetical protein [Dysgonomonas sp.]
MFFLILFSDLLSGYRLIRQKRVRKDVEIFIRNKISDYAILHLGTRDITIDGQTIYESDKIEAHYVDQIIAIEEGQHHIECYLDYPDPTSYHSTRYTTTPRIDIDAFFEKGKEYRIRILEFSVVEKNIPFQIKLTIPIKGDILKRNVVFEERLHI